MTDASADPPGHRSAQGDRAAPGRGIDDQRVPDFLALELGGSLGDDGDVAGIRLADLAADPELKAMGLGLWRQLKAPKPVSERIEDAGLTAADLFAPGMSEFVSTSSTAEELSRYRQKLAFRADLLEGLLEETLAELEHVNALTPMPAEPVRPGDSPGSASAADPLNHTGDPGQAV